MGAKLDAEQWKRLRDAVKQRQKLLFEPFVRRRPVAKTVELCRSLLWSTVDPPPDKKANKKEKHNQAES